MQHVDNRKSALETTEYALHFTKISSTVVGPQAAVNRVCIFDHLLYILHSASLPAFAHRGYQTQVYNCAHSLTS